MFVMKKVFKQKLVVLFCLVFALSIFAFLSLLNNTKESVNAETSQSAISFSGIASDMNNIDSSIDGYKELKIEFGVSGNDFFFADSARISASQLTGVWDNTNYATSSYQIGQNLTINGIAIYKIAQLYEDTVVNYSYGNNTMFVRYPVEIEKATDGYRFPVLHIVEGTAFVDKQVGEVSLSLIAGGWASGSFESMKDIDNYLTLTDGGLVASSYSFDHSESKAIAYGFSTDGDKIRFKFNFGTTKATANFEVFGYSITLNRKEMKLLKVTWVNPATRKDEEVASYSGLSIKDNTDFILEFDFTVRANERIVIGVDHAKVIDYSTTYYNPEGVAIWMLGVNGFTISDYVEKESYDSTILCSQNTIDLNEGDSVQDFSNLFTVFNIYDDTINSSLLTFELEEGAVSGGKYNAGVWKYTASLPTVGIKPATQKTIILNVQGENPNAVVTFDGENQTNVVIGKTISAPSIKPTKASDVNYDYYFDGWYVDGVKWNFATDVITDDTAFISHFTSVTRHYYLYISYTGIEKSCELFKLEKGTEVLKQSFEIEDYQTKIYINGESVNSVTLNSDTQIIVEYKKLYEHHEAKSSTCKDHGNVEYWTSFLYEGVYYGDAKGLTTLTTIELPLVGHDCADVTYTWTKVNGGYECKATTYCLVCGTNISETVTATSKVKVEPSCTQYGIREYSATFENEYLSETVKEEKIDKKEHTFTHHEEVPATRDKEGMKEYYYCEECNEYYIYNIRYMKVSYESLIIPKLTSGGGTSSGCMGGIDSTSLYGVLFLLSCAFVIVVVKRGNK